MDTNKNYASVPIPSKMDFERPKPSLHPPKIYIEHLDEDPFAQIEISEESATSAVPVPKMPEMDETRQLFYAMRKIARDHYSFMSDNSKTFYNQAVFMKDFEDDYAGQQPFSSYFPYYQQMGYEQLRTYFTWRTQVRKGNIRDISPSYAFLYIYELINNIGVKDYRDGLSKLVLFWNAYREFNNVIDRYVLQWIKDYYVYYPLEQTFKEFAVSNGLKPLYPAVFGYESSVDDSFDIYAEISKYNIKKSAFYCEKNHKLISSCFYFILSRLRKAFLEKKKCFDDLIFYPITKESPWSPFRRSLFYPVIQQPDRQVVLSARESYSCKNNGWTYKTVILFEPGKQLIGYIMKEMESALRKKYNFKHKLTANVNMCDAKTRSSLEYAGVLFPKFIQDAVSDFYIEFNRKVITVDIRNLNQIRQEALTTQEKLIVEEEAAPPQVQEKPAEPVAVKAADIWTQFALSLTEIEAGALKNLLGGGSLGAYASGISAMPEVLADGINQKSMDVIGDTVLDDAGELYDEYQEKLLFITQ